MSQPISLLLINSDARQARAVVQALRLERPAWTLEWRLSAAEAKLCLADASYDVVVIAHRLVDGDAFDLLDGLAGKAVILCVEEGQEAAAARGMRLGFSDYLINDSRQGFLLTLPLQVESAHQRIQVSRALQENEQRLALALDGSNLVPWDRSMTTGRVDGSEGWARMLGYLPHERAWDAEVWHEIVHPDDWPLVQNKVQAYFRGETPWYECEYRMRHKAGHWVWVLSRGRVAERDASGVPLRLVGTFMDITERHQTEEAAARRHRLLQAISRAQALFIVSTDLAAALGGVLDDLLALTRSAYGFVGEVLLDSQAQPYLLIHALTDISWDEASRSMYARCAAGGLEFRNTHSLFGAALLTRQPVIANAPAQDVRSGGFPPGHPDMSAFLGIPIHQGEQLVAMIALANNPDGYTQDDVEFLTPLCRTIAQLIAARRGDVERRKAVHHLQTTLDTIIEGIVATDSEGVIVLHNQRFLSLLELPASLMVPGVRGDVLVRFQRERGDFGEQLEYVDPSVHPYILRDEVNASVDRYLRKTRAGLTLEVKTRPLPTGGLVRTFSDVTHFVEAQSALRESETRFRSLTALSSDWYWEQDADFRFVRVDGEFARTSAMSSDDYLGRTRWDSGAMGLSPQAWDAHRRDLQAHRTFVNFEMQRMGPDGQARWVSISGMPIFDEAGRFKGYRGIGRDVTAQKHAASETQRLAFFDTLTGLPNRRLLLDRLSLALANTARSQQQGALLFIDLDNFKDLNDTLGHDVGDRLLEKVAQRLVGCVRQCDTVARLGGDEFVILFEDLSRVTDEAVSQAKLAAEKVQEALSRPYVLDAVEHYSTPSIGIALFSDRHQGVDELLKRADLAMYQAKSAGRNTVRFFDPEMQASVAKRAALELDLRKGLNDGQLLLYYQGVVNAGGRLVGAESLVRWRHPARGLILPQEFIPLAEQTGLILPLGDWVLREACGQLVRWAADPRTSDLMLAVNVSARQFRQSDFVGNVLTILAQSGARPDRLRIELTESLLLNDVEDIIGKMEELKASGVGFSLDDFGTGYSSLSYLKRLPLDQLKIDKSFVRDVLSDPNDAAIARTVVALAHTLGLAVVAEGVETDGQLAFLLAHGCQTFQGYLFGKPSPVHGLPWGSSARAGMAPSDAD